MKIKTTLFLLLISIHCFAWNGANNPLNFSKDLVYEFHTLPLSGEIALSHKHWPGYHWPNNKGSINNRWTVNNISRVPQKPSLTNLRSLPRTTLNELSPAEKFDIYMGRFDYPTVQKASRLTRENAKDWNGICHGLAAASKNHEEPEIKTVNTKDGLELSFFSSDLKALIAFEYASQKSVGTKQIGKRCFFSRNTPLVWRHNSCTDLNAGSFHIVITNYIGMRNEGVIADLDRFKEVWNHPITSFKTRILERGQTRIKVETSISYPDIILPQFGPVVATSFEYKKEKTYLYYLYLDQAGRITGGSWISKYRPDFMWIQDELDLPAELKELL